MATIVQQTNGEKTIYTADEYTQVQQKFNDIYNTQLPSKAAQTDMTNVMSQLADVMSQQINIMYPPTPLVGMKGDGSDETNTFLNLVNYAISNGVALFVPGLQFLTNTITLSDCKNLVIKGVYGKSILKVFDSTKKQNILQINGGTSLFINGVTFDSNGTGLGTSGGGGIVQTNNIDVFVHNSIFKNTDNSTASNAISCTGTSNVAIVKECTFDTCGSGPYLITGGLNSVTDSTIKNCYGWGIQFTSSQNLIAKGNHFLNNKGDIALFTSYKTTIKYGLITANIHEGTIGFVNGYSACIAIYNNNPSGTTNNQNIIISDLVFKECQCCPFSFGNSTLPSGFNYTCEDIIVDGIIYETSVFNSANGDFAVFFQYTHNISLSNLKFKFTGYQPSFLFNFDQITNDDITIDKVYVNGTPIDLINVTDRGSAYRVKLKITNIKVTGTLSYLVRSYSGTLDPNSEIIIENNPNDLITSNTSLTTSAFYNAVYFKTIKDASTYLTRDLCKKAFATGLLTYNTGKNMYYFYNGTALQQIAGAAAV